MNLHLLENTPVFPHPTPPEQCLDRPDSNLPEPYQSPWDGRVRKHLIALAVERLQEAPNVLQ